MPRWAVPCENSTACKITLSYTEGTPDVTQNSFRDAGSRSLTLPVTKKRGKKKRRRYVMIAVCTQGKQMRRQSSVISQTQSVISCNRFPHRDILSCGSTQPTRDAKFHAYVGPLPKFCFEAVRRQQATGCHGYSGQHRAGADRHDDDSASARSRVRWFEILGKIQRCCKIWLVSSFVSDWTVR